MGIQNLAGDADPAGNLIWMQSQLNFLTKLEEVDRN